MNILKKQSNTFPKGPGGRALLKLLLSLRKKDILDFATNLINQYGDFVHVKFGFKHFFFVSNPKDVNYILNDPKEIYDRPIVPVIKHISDDSLNALTTNRLWMEKVECFKRRIEKISISEQEQVLNAQLNKLFEKWNALSSHDSINLNIEMLQLTIATISLLMIRIDPSILDAKKINFHKYTIVSRIINNAFRIFKLPFLLNTDVQKAIKYKYHLVHAIAAEFLKNPTEDSYLNEILNHHNVAKLTPQKIKEIAGDILTPLYQGSDPADKLIAWLFYFAAAHPDKKKKLVAELDSVTEGKEVTFANLPQLIYFEMFLNEVLRLRGPYCLMLREALQDDVIRGYSIPKHSQIFIPTNLVQKHPSFWENPDNFYPERFENTTAKNNIAFIPFSKGTRACFGQHYAFRQALFVFARALQQFDFNLRADIDYRPIFRGVLAPKNDIHIHLKSRNNQNNEQK